MDITIYKTHTDSLMEQQLLPQLINRLPASLHLRARRYKSEVSAYNYVAGRLLLKQGLKDLGLDNNLEKIEFKENDKPIISDINFNISHSGHQVICGFSKSGQLGVDLEKIIPIDFGNFTSMFSAQEWAAIKISENPLRTFYWFWTRKESIIKAIGLNLNYLHKIELDISSDHIIIDGKQWYLCDLDVGKAYLGALCCEAEIGDIEMINLIVNTNTF